MIKHATLIESLKDISGISATTVVAEAANIFQGMKPLLCGIGGTTMTDELKPCPFCGGEARTYRLQYGLMKKYCIECLECGAELPMMFCSEDEVKAIAAWNRRPGND